MTKRTIDCPACGDALPRVSPMGRIIQTVHRHCRCGARWHVRTTPDKDGTILDVTFTPKEAR